MASTTRENSAVLCPQPRRVYLDTPSPQDKKLIEDCTRTPSSPSHGPDEAINRELHELLGNAKEQLTALRPLSAASTSAGPTPNPEDRTGTPAWSSPGGHARTPFDDEGTSPPSPQLSQALQTIDEPIDECDDARGGSKEVRKVFIGGIPQNMTQEDLYNIFGEIVRMPDGRSCVKKAWLQRQRAGNNPNNTGPPRNHRGFGFVIFHDGSAVERLLGKGKNVFWPLPDGRKLEIKRAVSSSDMDGELPSRGPTPKPSGSQASRPAAESPLPWGNINAQAAPPKPPTPQLPPTPTQQQQQAPLSPWRNRAAAASAPAGMLPGRSCSATVPNTSQASAFKPVAGVYVQSSPTMLATQATNEAPRLPGGNAMASLPQFPGRSGDGMVLGQHGTPMSTPTQDVTSAMRHPRQPWLVSAVPTPQGALQLLVPQALPRQLSLSRPSGAQDSDGHTQQPQAHIALSERVQPPASGIAAPQMMLPRSVDGMSREDLEILLRQAMPDHYDD